MASPEQFKRCMVMAGGGFRLGYYLGMHAAAVETGNRPDILLGSCGGAMAATIIAALPDEGARRAWVASPAVHDFLHAIRSTPRAYILPVVQGLLLRRFQSAAAPRVPNLFHDYLFELPPVLPLPVLDVNAQTTVAIIGAQVLFQPGEVGQLRGTRKLFRELVFCNERAAALLDGLSASVASGNMGENAIATDLKTDATMSVHDAVRISIADAYYFRCHSVADRHYSGGLIDLFPIEVAHRLARQVVMERKAPFNHLYALPAVRSVYGMDGNARLRAVHASKADVWIDTSDVAKALQHASIRKRLDWRCRRVGLDVPSNRAEFARQMDVQWQYGYQRARTAFGAGR